MAYQCKHGGGECDGCGACEMPVMLDYQCTPIYEGESYYDFDGEIVAEESLDDWLKEFERTAEANK